MSTPALFAEFVNETAAPAATGRRRLTIETPFIHRMQRRHFLVCNLLPLAGTAAALVLAAFVRPTAVDVALFAAMCFATGLCMSVGYHRLFTHCAFRAVTPVRVLLAAVASMAAQGPVISWVAIHRRHHHLADKEGDMHSPNLHGSGLPGRVRGFIHAHYTWMIRHEYPNVAHYAHDLLSDRPIATTSRLYYWWILLGLAIPAAGGGLVTGNWWGALTGLLWGGAVRIFILGQLIATLNSLLHVAGSKRFQLRDQSDNSRNSWILGLVIWGEGWHHNHHAFPASAWFGLSWVCFDVSYVFILLLKTLRLAWDVKVPTQEQILARSLRAPLQAATTAE